MPLVYTYSIAKPVQTLLDHPHHLKRQLLIKGHWLAAFQLQLRRSRPVALVVVVVEMIATTQVALIQMRKFPVDPMSDFVCFGELFACGNRQY